MRVRFPAASTKTGVSVFRTRKLRRIRRSSAVTSGELRAGASDGCDIAGTEATGRPVCDEAVPRRRFGEATRVPAGRSGAADDAGGARRRRASERVDDRRRLSWYRSWYPRPLRGGSAPPSGGPFGGVSMGCLVGVAVEVDGRLDVLVAELLPDELDRLGGGAPECRGGVAEVVQTDRGG